MANFEFWNDIKLAVTWKGERNTIKEKDKEVKGKGERERCKDKGGKMRLGMGKDVLKFFCDF